MGRRQRDTHFAFLEHVAVGDRLLIEGRDGKKQTCRVIEIRVVDARQDHIKLTGSQDRLTLITSFPFNGLQGDGPSAGS